MSRMAPLDLADIRDQEIHDLLAECEELGVPDAVFVGIFARQPDQLKEMLRAMLISHRDGNVDHKLKEIIRIQLARFAEDPYFSTLRSRKAQAEGLTEELIEIGCGDYEDSDLFTEREKVALRFAEQMFLDSTKVDKIFYDEMHAHFSDAEIMEIGSFIALFHGIHMVMRTLDARLLAAAYTDRPLIDSLFQGFP